MVLRHEAWRMGISEIRDGPMMTFVNGGEVGETA